jgi:hypothetical protein
MTLNTAHELDKDMRVKVVIRSIIESGGIRTPILHFFVLIMWELVARLLDKKKRIR